jgi:exopolysaccharide biosynthesis polyprenyl glycosylphosphotransferase
MAKIVNSSKTTPPYTETNAQKTGSFEMYSGATGPITRAISRRRSSRRHWRIFECIFIIIVDAVLTGAAFDLAYALRYVILGNNPLLNAIHNSLFDPSGLPTHYTYADISQFFSLEICIVIGLPLIFAVRGLYRLRLTGSWFRQCWAIITSCTIGLAILIAYYFVFVGAPTKASSRLLPPFMWAAAIVVICLGRLIVAGFIGTLYRLGIGETRVLVVGSGRLGKMAMQHITANPSLGYSIVGFLHDLSEPPSDFGRFKMLGTIDDLGLVIRSMQIDEVIIALPSNMHEYAVRSVKMCERLGASFKLIPDLYELSLSRIDMEAIEGIPLIGIKQVSLNRIQGFIVRLVDCCVAGLGLLLSSPFWLLLALAIKLTSPGPVIYKSTRVGLQGQLFEMWKFRSMYRDADQRLAALLAKNEAQGPLFKMKADPRITPVGRFLRRTSLDEVPQLVNVLKGDMSLVGPRPPLPREVAQYEEWQKGRLAIKPGLTGLWQVRGRSDISFDEGVLMDLYYIENWSLRLYFQILLRTIPAVLLRQGAY